MSRIETRYMDNDGDRLELIDDAEIGDIVIKAENTDEAQVFVGLSFEDAEAFAWAILDRVASDRG